MRLSRILLLPIAAAVLLAGCATPSDGPGGDGPGSDPVRDLRIAAPGEVLGQGTVLEKGDEGPVFCLGAVMDSYPPQCGGPELVGWEWPDDGMWESESGVTWGAYALTGRWDGESFTVTQPPIPLALYDPMRADPDPRTDPANAGSGTEDALLRIQDELHSWTDVEVLMSWPENGYLFVTVYYDDGTIQRYLDDLYGPDLLAVQSTLQDLPAA